ncbi:hypothetical protein BH11BAC7_BH11BAC7_36190 [soil metagenome]
MRYALAFFVLFITTILSGQVKLILEPPGRNEINKHKKSHLLTFVETGFFMKRIIISRLKLSALSSPAAHPLLRK